MGHLNKFNDVQIIYRESTGQRYIIASYNRMDPVLTGERYLDFARFHYDFTPTTQAFFTPWLSTDVKVQTPQFSCFRVEFIG